MRVFIGLLVGVLGFGVGVSWALDTANYANLKAAGLLTITKTADGVIVATTPHFDPATGAKLPSTVEGVSVAALTAQKVALQAQITAIDQVLADIQAMP